MITGLRKVKFTSKEDKGEVKTEFILKPLKKTTLISFERFKKIKDNPEAVAEMAPEMFKMIKESIQEIKNFQVYASDDALETKDLKKEEITDEFIDESLPLDLLMEIFGKVIEISKLTESEAKN